jgi:hypothetical protein
MQIKVGDRINVCAAVWDFCGQTYSRYYINSIGITVYPNPCTITPDSSTCLTLSSILIEFNWVNTFTSSVAALCNSDVRLKSLGSAYTDVNGVASFGYDVTAEDLALFQTNPQFDLRACIMNKTASEVIDMGAIRSQFINDTITVTATDSGATHQLDLILQPWSWYTPEGAAQQAVTNLININGAIANLFQDVTDYQYLSTEIFPSGDKVIIRINVRQLSLQSAAIPLVVQAILLLVAVGLILIGIGTVKDWIFGPVGAPGTPTGITNQQLTDAGTTYIKKQLSDCELVICASTTLSQDQKVACINNCNDNILNNWKGYQTGIFPNADHTPLDVGRTAIQECYATYNASAKTPADYTTYTQCLLIQTDTAINQDKGNTINVYPPDQPAGVTNDQVAASSDCWIPVPFTKSCLLSAKTGKTVLLISGLAAGGYVAFMIIKKK